MITNEERDELEAVVKNYEDHAWLIEKAGGKDAGVYRNRAGLVRRCITALTREQPAERVGCDAGEWATRLDCAGCHHEWDASNVITVDRIRVAMEPCPDGCEAAVHAIVYRRSGQTGGAK